MQRRLEPEVMDTLEEAIEYDAMDFAEVNTRFAQDAIALVPTEKALVLDAGTGTGRIPVLISQMRPQWQFIAIDLAENMLKLASQHLPQISWQLVDAKHLPYQDQQFDLVISNSLVHHLPEPLLFFSELKRVTKPNGGILIRDLLRPVDEEAINVLVASIGVEYNQHQTKLFRDSLYAALTLDEVNQLVAKVGLPEMKVYQSSDRHWTAKRSCIHEVR